MFPPPRAVGAALGSALLPPVFSPPWHSHHYCAGASSTVSPGGADPELEALIGLVELKGHYGAPTPTHHNPPISAVSE